MNIANDVILENVHCRLTVGADCLVKSLLIKESGEECLRLDEDIALFSVTQERPFNNEVKLAHPNKRTTYEGNALRREGDRLIVGFELAPYEAVVTIKEADDYIAFELTEFLLTDESYPGLTMSMPPVAEFRMIQLPVVNRENFGEWLNVSWDACAAVNVLGISPYARIDSARRKGYRILSADAVKGIKLKGCPAALIAAPTAKLLDCIASLEEDYDLPRGVESRRNYPTINSSEFWTTWINPSNVDEHIAYAKKGGFRMMKIYYVALTHEEGGYCYCGDYDLSGAYPNGLSDVKDMLDKLKAAGITPGLHVLQTHIGLKSRYVTPTVDARLNLKRAFTLAKPMGMDDTEVYVHRNPEDSEMFPQARYLTFGGEMIGYEAYTTEPPYKFTGCVRGAHNTTVVSHPAGERGGILDISEFGATSAYIDQNSDLQDEIADKIAQLYNQGFGFIYFDGSEGTNAPFGIHVPNAQYRVYKKLKPAPLVTEGAAKAHFGWHFQSGGNAFDVFPPEQFKDAIDRYPAEEAPRMREDFTRLNFGWWNFVLPTETSIGTQADLYEYGTSHAAAWDCPATIQVPLSTLRAHARTDDILEVMRRWEDVRQTKWLDEEQKALLRVPGKEYHLLINERGDYELVPYEQIETSSRDLRAFVFARGGETYVTFWHLSGSCEMKLPLDAADYTLAYEIGKPIPHGDTIALGARCYLKSAQPRETVLQAFREAILL